jgi:hypothetical protein
MPQVVEFESLGSADLIVDAIYEGKSRLASDRSPLSSGDNCFPGSDGRAIPITSDETDNTFAKFCRAVSRLVGRQFH